MRPELTDVVRLWDMPEAARAVQEFVANSSHADYLRSAMMQAAVERKIEIIGEAAGNVSRGFRQAHPEIPWMWIIGVRNVLAHEYDSIRLEVLWSIVEERIPELVRAIEPLVSEPPSERI